MRRYARMHELDIWYDGTEVDALRRLLRAGRPRPGQGVHREAQGQADEPGRLLEADHHGARAPADHDGSAARVSLSDDAEDEIVDVLLAGYRLTLQEDRRTFFDRFTEADTVRQVVGVGSVGMLVYLVLLEGRSGADPLFLQCKQAAPSVYEAHLRPAVHDNHGERVVAGKRMVQSATDLFVGWGALGVRDFYVRQYRDMKLIPTTEMIAPRLARFAAACGSTLARAHACSGDPTAIDAYMGKGEVFTKAMVAFARAYAEQNERDHARLVDAICGGDVAAIPE